MNDTIVKLKERYPHIPLLMFHRSVERTNNFSELFDILETFPNKYPIVWDSASRKWIMTKDLVQFEKFKFNKKEDDYV